MKLTRRELASAFTAATALAQAPAQKAPALSPEAELEKARDDVKTRTAVLARLDVPMTTEPAFSFRA
jgi:hypothetical protein